MKFEMKSKVGLVTFIFLLGVALYDLFLVLVFDTQSSISARMTAMGVKSPFFAMCIGVIFAHFWPMSLKTESVCHKCGEKAE